MLQSSSNTSMIEDDWPVQIWILGDEQRMGKNDTVDMDNAHILVSRLIGEKIY